jgi:hypothetical protein
VFVVGSLVMALPQLVVMTKYRFSAPFLSFSFSLTPSCEARLLASEVWTGFQFVVLTGVAVEKDNRLSMLILRHGVLPLALNATLTALVFWSDAEASASSVASASCYGRAENICVLAVIMAELELREVKWKVLLADVVVVPDDSALEQTPEVLNVVRMNLSAYIFAVSVRNRFMRISESVQVVITGVLVRGDQINLVAHSFADEEVKCGRICLLDDLTDDVALTRDGSDYRRLSAQAGDMLFLVPMAILVLAAYTGFVHFDDSHELRKFGVLHCSAEPMTEIPRGRIGRTNLALDLLCTDAFLSVQDAPENLEPSTQRIVRVLKDRSANNAEPIVLARLTEPVEGPRIQLIRSRVAATWTTYTNGPPSPHQIPLAIVIGREGQHQFVERHHAS